jgi:SAM-dependent methyltransferase
MSAEKNDGTVAPESAASLPASVNGWIPTLNKMGYMTERLSDPFSEEFAVLAGRIQTPVLDVGAAYGVATLEALRRGAQVIANDLDPQHLELLRRQVPDDWKGRLTLMAGSFPEELSFPRGTLGAILLSRVLHFFDGPRIERATARMYDWLISGGKVFVVAETPYTRYFDQFRPVYEQRRREGHRWPGFIGDLRKYNLSRAEEMPEQMHPLDPEVLTRVFEDAGFALEQAAIFARPDFPEDIRLDGREGVGVVARKP